jgi:hypothetical protein
MALPRLALLPTQNLSARAAPVKRIHQALEEALRSAGVELAPAADLEKVLAKHRIRYTGGLDREAARALRAELTAGGAIASALEAWSEEVPPRLALSVRLVSTDDEPAVLFADAFAASGDEAPGILALGMVREIGVLERRAVDRLAAGLAAFVDLRAPHPQPCPPEPRFRPRTVYRSTLLEDPARDSIAVLPFVNQSSRRDAGEVMALQFLRQLSALGRFDVAEPGLVRGELLSLRLVMQDGVSLDVAHSLLGHLRTDLLLAGHVREYLDPFGPGASPRVEFTALVIDRRTEEVVWSSSSRAEGDDGVFFFGRGRVTTANELACRMASAVVEAMGEGRPAPAFEPPRGGGASPAPPPQNGARREPGEG